MLDYNRHEYKFVVWQQYLDRNDESTLGLKREMSGTLFTC